VYDEALLPCLASCCFQRVTDLLEHWCAVHLRMLLTDCSIPRNKLVAHNVLLQVYCNHLYHITTKAAHSHPVSVSPCPRSTVLQAIGYIDHLLVIHDATHWTETSFVCHRSEIYALFLLSVLLSVYKS